MKHKKNKEFSKKTRYLIATGGVLVLIFAYFGIRAIAGTSIGVTIKTNPDLENGLVAHYTFDGPDMDNGVEDVSGNGNTGYLKNFTSTTTTEGVIGQALEFDNTDDYIDLQSRIVGTGPFTVSAWAISNMWDEATIIGENNNPNTEGDFLLYYLSQGSNNSVIFKRRPDSGANMNQLQLLNQPDINPGEWIYYTGTYDGVDMKLYINGELRADTTTSVSSSLIGNGGVNTIIGRASQNGLRYPWDGAIDDVRIYNRALSTTEIKRLYDLGATTKIGKTLKTNSDLETGLVGHWTFDGPNLLQNATDSSGSGNTGYLKNFTSTSTAVAEGVLGQALEFDGTDDYIDAGTGIAPVDEITICAWFYSYGWSTSADQEIIVRSSSSNLGNFVFEFNNSSRDSGIHRDLYFGAGGNNGIMIYSGIGSVIDLNEWNYLCTAYSNTDGGNIYVNGISKASKNGTGTDLKTANETVFIGGRSGSLDASDGVIDDVRIYNRALSADEIQRLYDLGATTHISTTVKTGGDLDNGLVGHWTFDGPDMLQNVADSSGSGNTGYLKNFTSTSTAVAEGVLGQALEFDGVDDYVTVNDSASLTFGNAFSDSPLSISAWVYYEGTGGSGPSAPIVSKYIDASPINGEYSFAISSLDELVFQAIDNKSTIRVRQDSDNTISKNMWHHVVSVYDASGVDGGITLYVDGVIVTSTGKGQDASYVAMHDLTSPFEIGAVLREDTTYNGYFKGKIDDVRIYNRALSASEIQRLYDLGR